MRIQRTTGPQVCQSGHRVRSTSLDRSPTMSLDWGEFRLKSHAADDLARLLPPRRSIHPRPTLGGGSNAGLTRTDLTTKGELLPVDSTLRRGFLEAAIPASPRRGSRRRVDGVQPGATSVRPNSRRNWQRSHEGHRGFAAALQSPLTDSNRRPPPYHGTSRATGGNPRQRFALVFAVSGAAAFAAVCHWLQPRGSIKAPDSREIKALAVD